MEVDYKNEDITKLPATESAKVKKKGFWTTKFIEFCKRTDLHGYKYVVMEDLTSFERSCWIVTIILSLLVATYFVTTAYKWYARNPIVTVIESTQGAIWDVPFPAVTVCDLNMVSKKAAYSLSQQLSLPENVTSDYVFQTFRLAPLLHTPYSVTREQNEQLKVLQRVIEYNNMSIKDMFIKISPASTCNQFVQKCMWKSTVYRCDQLFQQIFTVFSVCCSFNYFAKKGLGRNDRSSSLVTLNTPRRVASCGYQTALTVMLRMNTDDYYSSAIASKGALVLIDSAYNFPNQESPARIVNPSTEVLIALSPERTYTTPGIRDFEPYQRQCYFSTEAEIEVFERYSLHNCMSVHKFWAVKKLCGCAPLFFPVKDDDLRSCNFNDLECIESVLKTPYGDPIPEQTEGLPCLPECEYYDYIIEVAMGLLAKDVKVQGLPFFKNTSLQNCSLLNVFFNDLVSTRYRRDVYLNWQNILAAFGGLLSLMLGFTLISGFDLILFLVMHVGHQTCKRFITKTLERRKRYSVFAANDKEINNWIVKKEELQKKEFKTWNDSHKIYERHIRY